jgi:metal-responsive CopG/Arc/MetJ family transcriptional regulator
MTYIESVSFPDVTLKVRLEDYLKKTGMKRSPCITKAIDEYLQNRGA